MTRMDPRFLMSSGLMILAGAVFCRSGYATTIGLSDLIWPQIAMGAGLPLFFIPLMTLSVQMVDPKEAASASGIINFVRTLAGAIATASVVAIWTNKTTLFHAELADGSNLQHLNPQTMIGASPSQVTSLVDALVWQQSMLLSANAIWLSLSGIMAVCAVGILLVPDLRSRVSNKGFIQQH